MLQLDAAGDPVLGPAPSVPIVLPSGACSRSLVLAPAGNGVWYAAWWSAGDRGGVALRTSRSASGGASWSAGVVVDARDSSAVGCARPAPAIAAVPGGAVYLVYSLASPGARGVWLAATQARGSGLLWSEPVLVERTPRAGAVSLAARGDTVAVAYARPARGLRARGRGIALALSTTGARTIRTPSAVARSGAAPGVAPRVALRGMAVAVAWSETSAPGAGRTLVRRGEMRGAGASEPQ